MGVQVGTCDCPLCVAAKRADASAQVWQETQGKQRCKYIQCPRCGCLQPRRPEGQVALNMIFKPLELAAQDAAAADAAADAAGETVDAARRERKKVTRGKSVIAALFADDEDDDQ